ncbi:MAG: phosphate ABC transporter permease subunit PstC [Methylicorpusculum sp.]|uniref:phosphate ABC transporter permease subunit PstC n=1 Tax=Methylicorpusculum sp. TaxID=2713644 RepID=UPI00272137E0|nr:phosphate ABC transporter permease subunit PstC [Methylicorpusculum sp.]MDO8938617.1 phosphate ABC transporter permease subunit PstC [Methylicorpusculum sp.]MDO9241194.1 phosphate ABC transporter permease subunit PstC [Methylicorpusculum sp.]MDP2203624.1 phosphate ABC transporter permease subunit PstC [Methylicorpusculum sp.]
MSPSILLILLLILAYVGFYAGKKRAVGCVEGKVKFLHSLPGFYGFYVSLWSVIPALLITLIWLIVEPVWMTQAVTAQLPEEMINLPPERLNLVLNDIRNVVNGSTLATQSDSVILDAASHYESLQSLSHWLMSFVTIGLSMACMWISCQRIHQHYRARNAVEKAVTGGMVICSTIAIFTTLGIVSSVAYESFLFFQSVPVFDFLFGLDWSPQTAMRSDQVGSSGAFGAIPLFTGTLLVSLIAMLVAVPIGLMSAIYLSEFAGPTFRATAKPTLEILAGIPTVVYGFFAALTVAPFIRETGEAMGLSVSSESALAAGLVMGVMIIPFVSSLSDDVINAVPQSLRDGAYALGATQAETIKQIIFPAALPGIVGSILLAVSRAIGETMILVMAAGLSANLTFNPFEAVTTVTVQIVTLLVGDQEFDSPKTLAAFALGLVLFVVTLMLNVFALYIVRKYREQYE